MFFFFISDFVCKHPFELWDKSFNLAIILPACVLTVIAIIVTVVVSLVVGELEIFSLSIPIIRV